MKQLLEIKIDSGFKKLDAKNLSKLTGGLADVLASGKTKTSSGEKCDSTAVCNCTCPIIKDTVEQLTTTGFQLETSCIKI